jgi:hypothetical protein
MENIVTVNRLKFETFKKKRNKTFTPIPKWFNEKVFNNMLSLINNNTKLQSVKYVIDISKENNDQMPLRVAKEEYLDEIELIGGKVSNAVQQLNTSLTKVAQLVERETTPINSITKNDVIRVLEPFAKLANQCLHNSGLNKDQVIYAYNHAQITMQHLRDIEELIKKLTR